MSRVIATEIVSHWNHMLRGMQLSSDTFYTEIERLVSGESQNDIRVQRVTFAEGGVFSANREYLQIRRRDNVFHVCAAPYGNGFFISWWLGNVESGLIALIATIPKIGPWLAARLRPALTYYRYDTMLMFQELTHAAVTEAINACLAEKGKRELSDYERKPLMRDFLAKLA
jgi:hypothetical protein